MFRARFAALAILLASALAYPQTLTANAPTSAGSDAPAFTEPTTVPAKSTPAVSVGSSGLIFSTADGGTSLRVHGYVQADNRMFTSTSGDRDYDQYIFRRIRPLFEGTLFHQFDYRFMPDFGQSNSQIQELYLELKTIPFAKLRVGKFKEPIGLEVLRSDRELVFSERSMASDLVPLRYIGAQISGTALSETISYAGGFFNGSSDGSNGAFTSWAKGSEGAGRLFLQPFAATKIGLLKGLGVGMAGSFGDQHGTIAGLKTVGQSTFFKYSSTAVANGAHSRIAPQAYYYAGPLGIMVEYTISSQDVLNKKLAGEIRNQGWQVVGSVMVTGEKNSYAGVRQKIAFEPQRNWRHLGAFELAGRASRVTIDRGAFPLWANPGNSAQEATEYGVGFNWYLNRFVKLVTDYEHTNFRMAPGNKSPFHDENVLMSRVQLAF
jgi:phosphate-selective porin OprO/OprP